MPGGSAPEGVPFSGFKYIYMTGREICYLGREGCSVIQWVFVQKAVILLQKVIVSSVTLLVEIPVHNQ